MHSLYKEHILELYRNPENKHELENPTHTCREHNPLCGDDITLYLKIKDDIVVDASYTGVGCAITTASASLLTDSIKGKPVADVKKLGAKDIIELLGIEIGPVRIKCATIPLLATHNALEEKND